MPTISVKGVTKEYHLGNLTNIKQTLLNVISWATRKPLKKRTRFHALSNINFEISPGEVVGIIGINGAGKSTLLKLLAKITTPTSGNLSVAGKVAPLIEVGAGLNPELTGRENIFLNAAILGIPQKTIKQLLPGIISFAELEQFIDTPVKRYSSGMAVRLGFSIATSIDADILIVDEVLAVGDLAFQRKCFDRMEKIIKQKDKTVLLVSHNIRQVERICKRVILLDKGKIIADGQAREVCTLFYKRSNEKIAKDQFSTDGPLTRIESTGEIELIDISIISDSGETTNNIASRSTLRVRVKFLSKYHIPRAEIIIGTHTTDFFYLTAGSTLQFDDRPDVNAGENLVEYIVESFPMAAGVYAVRFSIFDGNHRPVFMGESLKSFTVTQLGIKTDHEGWWTLNLPTKWNISGKEFYSSETLYG